MRLARLRHPTATCRPAKAVMADIARQGVDQVLNLRHGWALLPRETVDLLMAQPWVHVRGNHERQVYDL